MAKKFELHERGTNKVLYPVTLTECTYHNGDTLDSIVDDIIDNKAEITDLSNVLAEQVIDDAIFEDFGKVTREELKKDLFIDLWNKACGKYGRYNPETGYFELNGLTDITYEQAIDIYSCKPSSKEQSELCSSARSSVRTNIPYYTQWEGGKFTRFAQNNHNIEVAYLPNTNVIDLFQAFSDCTNLKYVYLIGYSGGQSIDKGVFYNCKNLQRLEINYIVNLDVRSCPLITLDSFKYIKNTQKGTTRTWIVHPDIYAKLIGDTSNKAAASLSPDELVEWNKFLVEATESGTTFAIN